MASSPLNVPPETVKRILGFRDSPIYLDIKPDAKSDYWNHFSKELKVNVDDNKVHISGNSGFYVPPRPKYFERFQRSVRSPIHATKVLFSIVKSIMRSPIRTFYEKAFNLVMGSEPVHSKYLINHKAMTDVRGVLSTTAEIKRHYKSWSGYSSMHNVINQYYYSNILRNFATPEKVVKILEIGGGSGNLASIFHHDWHTKQIFLIDLPESIVIAATFLASIFPQAKIDLPNEILQSGISEDADFVFLTPNQIELVPENSIDLVINCHSFQEMTHSQIAAYFILVNKVVKDQGLFFCANRIEKFPFGADIFLSNQLAPANRFSEYPWNIEYEDLVYETSQLHRLVQDDNVAIRLQRIKK